MVGMLLDKVSWLEERLMTLLVLRPEEVIIMTSVLESLIAKKSYASNLVPHLMPTLFFRWLIKIL